MGNLSKDGVTMSVLEKIKSTYNLNLALKIGAILNKKSKNSIFHARFNIFLLDKQKDIKYT